MRGISNALAKARRAGKVGARGIAQRVAWRAYSASGAADLFLQLDVGDILTDVPRALPVPQDRPRRGHPLRIGWVSTAPAPGSGGHTTLFRMVAALESRGHQCTLYFYDRHGLDVAESRRSISRHWPGLRSDVRDVRSGIANIDAVVASGWESTHLIAKYASVPTRRFYFMQDYEPYFYGHGAEHEFASMSYLLPFRRIALGEMLYGMVQRETGLASDIVPFGCDSDAYCPPSPPQPRSGIVFYCRPDYARRGYQLARVALRLFHQRHPEQEIHIYGARPRDLDFPYVFHGRLSTRELNELYGRTIAGLAMSFTNITLVAEEMLAAGNIPVVNEMQLAREMLPNAHIRWATPTASALATALGDAVSARDIDARSTAAAASVTGRSWEPTKQAFMRIIEDEVYGL